MTAIEKAVRHYRKVEKSLRVNGIDLKPNLSRIARIYEVAKSSLWYALQK